MNGMDKTILVINCGSSSVKFALLHPTTGQAYLTGLAEKLGLRDALISFRYNDGTQSRHPLAQADHDSALHTLVTKLAELKLIETIAAIGHRIVHGGEHFSTSIQIDEKVLTDITRCSRLAPLHNPSHIMGIRCAQTHFPSLPQVAVFDTAFHQTLPERAYLYAIPTSLYQEHAVRRYGFHGTSYRYISLIAAKMLNKPLESIALIGAHLGNGASAAAILGGQSIDTTMGLTPLEGLVMGTRSGDVDPGLFSYLSTVMGLTIQEITDLLNQRSGLLGLSGLSNDCRELEEAAQQGHQGARLALDIFCYRLAKAIAALTVPLGRLDALVFTGGIGENSSWIRQHVVAMLGFLNLSLDSEANHQTVRGITGAIEQLGSIPILVINTNEEAMIAHDTATLIGLTPP